MSILQKQECKLSLQQTYLCFAQNQTVMWSCCSQHSRLGSEPRPASKVPSTVIIVFLVLLMLLPAVSRAGGNHTRLLLTDTTLEQNPGLSELLSSTVLEM